MEITLKKKTSLGQLKFVRIACHEYEIFKIKKIINFLKKQEYLIFINLMQISEIKLNKLKKYRKKTELRKPGNLMIRQIKEKWHIKDRNSFMIGDKISDKICAKKSKLYFEFAEKNFLSQIKRITKRF